MMMMINSTHNLLKRCLRTQKIRTSTFYLDGDCRRVRPCSSSTPFPGSRTLSSTQLDPPSRTSRTYTPSLIEQRPTRSLRQHTRRPSQVHPHRKQAAHETC